MRNVPKEYEDEEEDEEEDPFKMFKNMFGDPSKLFRSKQFKNLFNDIFKKILENPPPGLEGLNPDEIKKEFMKNKSKFGFNSPFLYGFNLKFGPDGKPTIDSFGNIKSKGSGKPEVKKSREPLVEVIEEADQITVIAEMPGITKEDIVIKATSRSLMISSKFQDFGRNYKKEIDLPAAINSDIARASYKNGLLEIKLQKIDETQTDIKIE